MTAEEIRSQLAPTIEGVPTANDLINVYVHEALDYGPDSDPSRRFVGILPSGEKVYGATHNEAAHMVADAVSKESLRRKEASISAMIEAMQAIVEMSQQPR